MRTYTEVFRAPEFTSLFVSSSLQVAASTVSGLALGTYGNYLVSAQLAWRTTRELPASEADKKPRAWISLQKWL